MVLLGERAGVISNWEDFSRSLLTRFRLSPFEDPMTMLTKLRQSFTVEHYQTQFEELVNHTEGLNESFMIRYFVGGLKEDSRLSIQMIRPRTLTNVIGLAECKKRKSTPTTSKGDWITTNQIGINPSPKSSNPIIKKLPLIEMKERREKGLCYLMERQWPNKDDLYMAHDNLKEDSNVKYPNS